MGQKVHPRIFRTGVIYNWGSTWFANKRDFAALLEEDTKIKDFLKKKLKEASVDRIEVERTTRAITVTIHSAKPGMVIGRGGTGAEDLKKEILKAIGRGGKKDKVAMNLNIIEVGNPSLSANVVIQSMIADTEKRMAFRRILKTHLERVQKAGAKGVKLQMKGRLNGAEIAREEKLSWGSVPLQNLRADINFASDFARTIFGTIGVKVWIYRGEIFDADKNRLAASQPASAAAPAARPASRPTGTGSSAPRPAAARPAPAKPRA
ncbi:MAG: ribosomal protein [Candidatus Parcubacteria bacterium]